MINYRKKLREMATNFKREEIEKELQKCTSEQHDTFRRIYKNIKDINEDDLDMAYHKVMTTLDLNGGE